MVNLPHFFNPFDGPADGPGGDDDRLDGALRRIRDANPPGVTLPAELWVARTAILRRGAIIPAAVSLRFAPGARFVLEGGARPVVFRVEGPMDAGRETRFQIVGTARVELVGPLEAIVADWWTTPEDDPALSLRTGRVVALALDTHWRRRRLGLPAAPILLGGPYSLEEPLSIAPPARTSTRSDVVLRGSWYGSGEPPTFVLRDGTGRRSSMLRVSGGVALTMEHVAVDTRRLQLATEPAAEAYDALHLGDDFDGTVLRDCGFNIGEYWGVVVGYRGDGSDVGALRDAFAREGPRLTLERCEFVGVGHDERPTFAAVQVGVAAPTLLAIRDCAFRGRARQMVSVIGGALEVVGCTFDNTFDADGPSDEAVDIALTRLPDEPSSRHLWRQAVALARPEDTHLTVTHCVSSSARFLYASAAFGPLLQLTTGSAVLSNVRHGGDIFSVAAVDWDVAFGARSLVLQGCTFGGAVEVHSRWSSPDMLGQRAGVVVDLGTRFVASPNPAPRHFIPENCATRLESPANPQRR